MNALEHLAYLDLLRAKATPGTLRALLHSLEGVEAAENAISRGLRAWAVERWTGSPGYRRLMTRTVFGTCVSDAKRRASAPARLGPEIDSDETVAAPILSGWDERIVWPLLRESAR